LKNVTGLLLSLSALAAFTLMVLARPSPTRGINFRWPGRIPKGFDARQGDTDPPQ
jgi:hypothetical protein